MSHHNHCNFFIESHWSLHFPLWVSLEMARKHLDCTNTGPTYYSSLVLQSFSGVGQLRMTLRVHVVCEQHQYWDADGGMQHML